MLATLNLKLSPVEIAGGSPASSASLQPGSRNEVESGFANMLRLRTDAAFAPELAGGEILPRGGSELPIAIETVALTAQDESHAATNQVAGDLSETSAELPPQVADIDFAMPVLYPPPVGASTGPSHSLVAPLTVAPPGQLVHSTPPAELESNEALRLPRANHALTNSDAAARLQDITMAMDERPDVPPVAVGLREGGRVIRTSTTAPVTAGIDEYPRPPDLPKPSESMLPRNMVVPGEEGTAIIRTHEPVPQPLQTLHTQLSSQPTQAPSAVIPNGSAVAETAHAIPVQKSTDLIGTPVKDPAWGEQLSERVVLMASNHLKTAEIRLTPAELGPLRVQVSVDEGATNVSFQAQHAVTREAIEQALPRLREMLAENGLSLGQADVGEQGVAQGNKDGETEAPAGALAPEDVDGSDSDDGSQGSATVSMSNGLVDTFA